MKPRSLLVWALVLLLVLAGTAVAAKGGNGGGNGGGNSGGNSGGNGGGNGGGNSGGNSGGNGGGNSGGNGGTHSGGNSASHAGSDGAGNGHGPPSDPGRSSDHPSGSSTAPSGNGADPTPSSTHAGPKAYPVPASGASPPSSSTPAPIGPVTLEESGSQAVASGPLVIAPLQDRPDLTMIEVEGPLAPVIDWLGWLIGLAAFAALLGTVRSPRVRRFVSQLDLGPSAARHYRDAVSAGLDPDRWRDLTRETYARLRQLDPDAVAFWMQADVTAVRRWQGRNPHVLLVKGPRQAPADIATV